MTYLFKILTFLRLTEGNNVLSLTNIALIICLFKLCFYPAVNMAQMIPLFLALSAHHADKFLNKDSSQ